MYLIDGYNLIFSLIQSKESLRTLRQKIVRYLQKKFALKKLSGMLIFDGSHRREEESGLSYPSPLIVAYAPKGQSADAYIVEQIEISKSPKQITVVTNDKGLIRHAKSAGAKVLANEAFITWLSKQKTTETKPQETSYHIKRLEKIFLERLERDEEG